MKKFFTVIVIAVVFGLIPQTYAGRVASIQNVFNAGELSPKMAARTDFAKYHNGCETLKNFVPWRHGGAAKRPGTYYVADVKTHAKKVRLIPFEFSTTQAYMLEFGDLYMRVIKDHGQVIAMPADHKVVLHFDGNDGSTIITDTGDTGHTWTAHGDAKIITSDKKYGTGCLYCDGTGDYVSMPDHDDVAFGSGELTIDFWVNFASHTNYPGFFGQRQSNTERFYMHYDRPNKRIVFKVMTGGVDIIDEASPADSFDGVVDTWHHIALIRGWAGGANDWAICVNGAAIHTFTDSSAMPNFTTGTFNVGWCDLVGGTGYPLHGMMDEFRLVKGDAEFTADFTPYSVEYPQAVTSTPYELATPYVEEHLPFLQFVQSADTMWIVHPSYKPRKLTRTGHASWALTSYAPTADPFTSADNYPSCVAFYEERLFFGATNDGPQKIWSTKTGDFEDMTTGAVDDDGLLYTIAADQVNVIRWLNSGKYLMMGTIGGEWRIWSGSLDEPMTPTNIKATREDTKGSANIMPVRLGNSLLFVQRAGRKVRELTFQWEHDGWASPDLTLLADHITEGGIKYFTYQQEPHSIVLAVRNDGVIGGMTYDRPQDVVAWFTIETAGDFESVGVIPGTGAEYEVWVSVKREIDGATKRYIEYIKPFDYGTDKEDAFYVDSGLTYDGASVATVSGLDHLEGETVQVYADGIYIGTAVVASGAIVLPAANVASKIHIGLSYEAVLQTMRIEAGSATGTAQGKEKHLGKYTMRFYRTRHCEAGPDAGNLDDNFGFGSDEFTGDKTLTPLGGWETEGQVYVKSDEPYPLNLLAIMVDVVTND